jgi:hypothetical protein
MLVGILSAFHNVEICMEVAFFHRVSF